MQNRRVQYFSWECVKTPAGLAFFLCVKVRLKSAEKLATIESLTASSLYGPPPWSCQADGSQLLSARGPWLHGLLVHPHCMGRCQWPLLDTCYLTTWTQGPTDLASCTAENSKAKNNWPGFGLPLHPQAVGSHPADCSLLLVTTRCILRMDTVCTL